ncbi:hypothetical protein [Salinicola socius]|uniref:Uncharacterized protein n=1 Tax=Salinicola socius TaxID=404433 RepID=A0A1Q8SRJ5_9GAMM|nr:hypothetical protein [Salinicola socius]OLO04045.1 hypothetical protein BTW07_12270 [Salinicola socius]
MKHDISCPRCGCSEAHSSDSDQAWDEITCRICNEFIGTRDYLSGFHSQNYRLHALSLSLGMVIEMAHQGDLLPAAKAA